MIMKITCNLHTKFPDNLGRVYSQEAVSKMIEEYNKRDDKFIEMKSASDSIKTLDNICGKITDISESNGTASIDVEPIGYNGEIFNKLYCLGSLKVSPYGKGSVDSNNVVNDFTLEGFNIVSAHYRRYIIIYHLEDNDGVLSGTMMKHYLINALGIDDNDIKMYPATYNTLSSICRTDELFNEFFDPYTNVIMTDISFNDPQRMKDLKKMFGNNFVWIDHHAPIIKESILGKFDDVLGVRDTTRSAILNMYKYCYDPYDVEYLDGNAPIMLRYLSAWDSWSYEQEGLDFDQVRWFNTGMTLLSKLSSNYYYNIIDKLLEHTINENNVSLWEDAIRIGKEKCDMDDDANEKLIKVYGDFSWTVDGHSAVMVVTSGSSNSLMFKSVTDRCDVGIVFKHCANGNWTMSLYNVRNDSAFHCGEYLKKKYKGGGHAGAAGCTLTENKFISILKKKAV